MQIKTWLFTNNVHAMTTKKDTLKPPKLRGKTYIVVSSHFIYLVTQILFLFFKKKKIIYSLVGNYDYMTTFDILRSQSPIFWALRA